MNRNEEISKMYQNGLIMAEIGKEHNLTKQGVSLILKHFLTKKEKKIIKSQNISKSLIGKTRKSKKRGRRTVNGGYIFLLKPEHPNATKDGYVLEHRLKMEKKIGRYLTKKEVVHHLNWIKDDNRIQNLILFSSSQHNYLHGKQKKPVLNIKKDNLN